MKVEIQTLTNTEKTTKIGHDVQNIQSVASICTRFSICRSYRSDLLASDSKIYLTVESTSADFGKIDKHTLSAGYSSMGDMKHASVINIRSMNKIQ